MTDINPALRYFVKHGVDLVRVLNALPCAFLEQCVEKGMSPAEIFDLVYGAHPVTLRPKPDRRATVPRPCRSRERADGPHRS